MSCILWVLNERRLHAEITCERRVVGGLDFGGGAVRRATAWFQADGASARRPDGFRTGGRAGGGRVSGRRRRGETHASWRGTGLRPRRHRENRDRWAAAHDEESRRGVLHSGRPNARRDEYRIGNGTSA